MKKQLLLLLCGLLAALHIHAQQRVGYQDNWWKPNADVYAIVRSGNTVYLGGNFTYVGPSVPKGAALSTVTGMPDVHYAQPNGTINACAPDGAGGWYIGGTFSAVGGQTRSALARINADGTLHPWNPNANAAVYSLATSGNTVYVGGDFTTVGGQPRNNIAALDTAIGSASSS